MLETERGLLAKPRNTLGSGRLLRAEYSRAVADNVEILRRAYEVPFAHLITVRDGLIRHFQMHSDQRRALEAAGLRGADP